jgi:leader peptidase (prepilin peptidase) / N-methyltransferase
LDLLHVGATLVAGLAFGSFLNVCISRIPRDLSIVSPASFCPHCRAPILWRDNVPVVAWILLRGHCRNCGRPISLRYPAVEVLTAALFVACFLCFGSTWLTLKACVFCFLMLGLIFMDAETGLLPHEFTYTGIVLGLASAWLVAIDAGGTAFLLAAVGVRGMASGGWLGLVDSAAGAVLGAAFFYLAWALYYLARRRHGMGFGDIAMMAAIGAFLGLKLAVLVIFFAPILATAFAITTFAANRRPLSDGRVSNPVAGAASGQPILAREIPFGVFLGISSLVALFFGKQIWAWYLGQFR